MITISKKVEYSVIFIAYLSKNTGKKMSLTKVSQKLHLPYRFLGQLAMNLKMAGIVTSREGKSGGYELVANWQNKSMFDLLEALGENRHMVKCMGDEKCARAAHCELKNIWQRVESSFVKELKLIKLETI